MRIFIDADACPVPAKEILFRTSLRLQIPLVLVANQYMRLPAEALFTFIRVDAGPDEADNHIVEIMEAGDLIITADIPLADRVIKKEGFVIDPRGQLLDKENIGQRLAIRNFLEEMRNSGQETEGPKPYGSKEKQNFAQKLDQILQKKR